MIKQFIKFVVAFLVTVGIVFYTKRLSGSGESDINFTFTLIQTSISIAGLTFVAEAISRGKNHDFLEKDLITSSKDFILAALLFLLSLSTFSMPEALENTPLSFLNAPLHNYPIIVSIGALCFILGMFIFSYGLIRLYFTASEIRGKIKTDKKS